MTGTREMARGALGILVVLGLLATSAARAQAPEPNERVVRAEAPVVAGNAVNAKKRALADALRQATERALAEIVKQSEPLPSPPPPGVAQLKASLANSAQRFVRSYRLIEQQTEGGVLRVMVEADVDTVLLRQALDRARGSAPAAAPASAPVANFMLVAGTTPRDLDDGGGLERGRRQRARGCFARRGPASCAGRQAERLRPIRRRHQPGRRHGARGDAGVGQVRPALAAVPGGRPGGARPRHRSHRRGSRLCCRREPCPHGLLGKGVGSGGPRVGVSAARPHGQRASS